MDTDTLDSLIDAAASPSRPIDRGDLRAMIAEAGAAARPPRPRRRTRAAIAVGAALALVVGGGGVAVASGLVTWPAGFENPDASFDFALPSGRQCEFRMVVAAADPDPADQGADDAIIAEVQHDVVAWLRDGDLLGRLDLVSARSEAERIFAEQREAGMTIAIAADGWLTDVAVAGDGTDADALEAFVIDRAVRAAMVAQLRADGHPEDTWTFGADGGMKCAAE